MNTAIIGLGSNILPDQNIPKAKALLVEQFTLLAESEFIVTKAWQHPEQPDFLNGALLIKTSLDQLPLKKNLEDIEKKLDRRRAPDKFAPRTIDLDLLVWNNAVVHRDFYERDFVRNAVLALSPAIHY